MAQLFVIYVVGCFSTMVLCVKLDNYAVATAHKCLSCDGSDGVKQTKFRAG